ncbi:hypothetical protein K9F62_02495 [Desulfovibrio sp. JY]|nr:hypothetical protein K9F62_02495 [Desulfovibrio sp. JY]
MSAINFSSAAGAEASYGIVSKTLDTMNNAVSSSATSFTPTDKETIGAAVVSKTLDYLNSGGSGSASSTSNDMSQTYQASKDVLGAYTSGIGSIADANA